MALSENVITPDGWPTDLAKLLPSGTPSVAVGQTVAIKVKLTSNSLERPGFGVVFKVVSGSATLYGGEGQGPTSGSRYDLTNLDGESRMTLKVNASGSIEVQVQLPQPDPDLDLMNGSTVTLSPNVSITGIP